MFNALAFFREMPNIRMKAHRGLGLQTQQTAHRLPALIDRYGFQIAPEKQQ